MAWNLRVRSGRSGEETGTRSGWDLRAALLGDGVLVGGFLWGVFGREGMGRRGGRYRL